MLLDDQGIVRRPQYTLRDDASSRVRRWRTTCAMSLLVMLAPIAARADHHEAQWSMRPFAGIAELQESGADSQRAMIGGLSLGFAYGVSNDLDISGELLGLATTAPRFMATAIVDGGAPYRGPLVRRTDS